jgi:Zn-dependent M28 family amino/carboxypeptidase
MISLPGFQPLPMKSGSSKLKLIDRSSVIRLTILMMTIASLLIFGWSLMIWMPGVSYQGKLPPLTVTETALQTSLKRDIDILSSQIGRRNSGNYENLVKAKVFLAQSLEQAGYTVKQQNYQIDNKTYTNLAVEIPGSSRSNEVLVIGAHYDSAFTSPGADDNATGAVAVLALAREFVGTKPLRTLRFVEFTNEEPPLFWTDNMGSLVYAKETKSHPEQKIVGMFSLETLGYYSTQPNTQEYPPPLNLLYPSTGNFLGFVSNIDSRELLRNTMRSFRAQTQFPSEGAALPSALPGVGWSDQWSFWQQGYQALMVTDTATFRYPHYHTLDDTSDKIDFERLSRVTSGLSKVIRDFVGLEQNMGEKAAN